MAKLPSLYELTAEWVGIEEAIIENEGEITPEIEEAIAINQENIAAKSSAYAKMIAEYNARIESHKAEIARQRKIVSSYEKAVENLKTRLIQSFNTMGKDSFEGDDGWRFSVRKYRSLDVDENTLLSNNGVFAQLEELDLPSYVTVEAKVSKKALDKESMGDEANLPKGVSIVYTDGITIR